MKIKLDTTSAIFQNLNGALGLFCKIFNMLFVSKWDYDNDDKPLAQGVVDKGCLQFGPVLPSCPRLPAFGSSFHDPAFAKAGSWKWNTKALILQACVQLIRSTAVKTACCLTSRYLKHRLYWNSCMYPS